jgi:DNA-binding IclR family transcriptional regulator
MNESQEPQELEREVESLRDDLTGLVEELERRRQKLAAIAAPLRSRQNRIVLALVLLGGSVLIRYWRGRKPKPSWHAQLLARMLMH